MTKYNTCDSRPGWSQVLCRLLKALRWILPIGLALAGFAALSACAGGPEGAPGGLGASGGFSAQADDRYITWTPAPGPVQEYHILWSREPDPVTPPRPADRQYVRQPDEPREAWIEPSAGSGLYYVRVAVRRPNGTVEYSPGVTTSLEAPVNQPAGPEGRRITLAFEGPELRFTAYGDFPQGFKVVWSKGPGPAYPPRENDHAVYRGPFDLRTHWLNPFAGPGTYTVRVYEYLGEAGVGPVFGEATVALD